MKLCVHLKQLIEFSSWETRQTEAAVAHIISFTICFRVNIIYNDDIRSVRKLYVMRSSSRSVFIKWVTTVNGTGIFYKAQEYICARTCLSVIIFFLVYKMDQTMRSYNFQ